MARVVVGWGVEEDEFVGDGAGSGDGAGDDGDRVEVDAFGERDVIADGLAMGGEGFEQASGTADVGDSTAVVEEIHTGAE
jgi:hypothetical protein